MFLESEDLGVDGEGCGLVVDDDVGQCDPHMRPSADWFSLVRSWGISPILVNDAAVDDLQSALDLALGLPRLPFRVKLFC